MTLHLRSVSAILLWACCAFAQSSPNPSFEVASIKPAGLPADGRLLIMMRGGPGDPNDPGRVTWENVSLKDMLRTAYGIRDYQISGPDWLSSARFNVNAKFPPDTDQDRYALMWQNLLKERFGLVAHMEKRDLAAYALVEAKGGHKMPDAVDDPPAAEGNAGGPNLPPPGSRGSVMRNGMMMMRGNGHLEAKGVPIALLVDMLSRQMDRPVEDQTGLKGKYDIKLDYTPDESAPGLAARMGVPMPMPAGNGEAMDHPADNNGASIFTAVQAQLGLKLEARKLPLEILVVEKAEKVPTEN